MILEVLLLQNHKDFGVFKSPLWKFNYLIEGKIYINIYQLLSLSYLSLGIQI